MEQGFQTSGKRMQQWHPDEWQVILGPDRRPRVESAWKEWLTHHDVSRLDPEDIRIDVGRAQVGDFCRYSIRRDALSKVVPPIQPDDVA